jgi:hypothetical protein
MAEENQVEETTETKEEETPQVEETSSEVKKEVFGIKSLVLRTLKRLNKL